MEHIVQFAVGIDDKHIQEIMEQSAAKQIMDDIKMLSHGRKYYSGSEINDDPKNLEEMFKDEIAKYVKEHADEVIAEVIREVSKNMMKTKKVKDALDLVVQ